MEKIVIRRVTRTWEPKRLRFPWVAECKNCSYSIRFAVHARAITWTYWHIKWHNQEKVDIEHAS